MIAAVAKDISSTDTLTAAVSRLRVLMAAGGTGGHVYPALAIADAIKKRQPDAEILFVGTRDRMEWSAVPNHGYNIKPIWISGLHRRLTFKNLLFPVKLIVSLFQSLLLIRNFRPDIVIACGGFVSGPVGRVAAAMGIPLFLQEQNSFPGVTNRLLAEHAEEIFTAFEEAENHLPKEKTTLTGNPVRNQIRTTNRDEGLKAFGFKAEAPVLLVMGGSGGAKALNDAMIEHLPALHDRENMQIIWQCGAAYIDSVRKRIDPEKYENLRLTEYIDEMPNAYAAADLVVTRAGAGTCSELAAVGQPAVLVPSPNVAGDHQTQNARSFEKAGAALLLKEENLQQSLFSMVSDLIRDTEKLKEMQQAMNRLAKPGAADTIADKIFSFVKEQQK